MNYFTGYFGNPTTQRSSIVHVVDENWKPICNYKPSKGMKFLQCSTGIFESYVKCKRCRKKIIKLENEKVKSKI